MRKKLIGAAVAATVGVAGVAFAQEQQPGQGHNPAASQTEQNQSSKPATKHEGAAAQAKGQTGEERQNRTGAMQKGHEEGQAGMQNQRQGEAQANEKQPKKEQTGEAAKPEHGASQAQTERGKAHESGKAAESQTKMKGAEEGQRAGETHKTEKGQAAQTQHGTQGARGEERAGATQQNREGEARGGQTATQSRENTKPEGQSATPRTQEGMTQQGQTATGGGANAGGAASVEARGNTRISNEKAARISDTLMSTAAPAHTSLNINVDVGQPLPGNVELLPLPSSVVEIVPEYRGYDYVVVHDEIVIVQPTTRKVVEVIRRGGGVHATRETVGRGHRLTLNEQQQRLIREAVRKERLPQEQVNEQLSYGVAVPQSVTLEPVPPTIVAQIPMIEPYRMFITGSDSIVLVDPGTREVVDVID